MSANQPAAANSLNPATLTLEATAFLALLLGLVYLFATNSTAAHWSQGYNPAGIWQLSTLIAALPIVVLLGAMAILRLKAHVAAIAGLVTALLAAIVIFHMPARLAFTAAAYGAGYGLFPVCWIILPVIFLYDLTVQTGHFVTLQQSLTGITADSRLQLLLIAFALGSFFEGTSGFGTPVAICAAILISLGFRPLQAAALSLLATPHPSPSEPWAFPSSLFTASPASISSRSPAPPPSFSFPSISSSPSGSSGPSPVSPP